jgi:hypothetical protein
MTLAFQPRTIAEVLRRDRSAAPRPTIELADNDARHQALVGATPSNL